jgi:hypothetical protein
VRGGFVFNPEDMNMPDDPQPDDARRTKAAKALDAFLDRLIAMVVADLTVATTEPGSQRRGGSVGGQKPTE